MNKEKFLDLIQQDFNQENFAAAQEKVAEFTTTYPEDSAGFIFTGLIATQLEDLLGAKSAFFKAIKDRVNKYSQPKFNLTYETEITDQKILIKILDKNNCEIKVNKSIQIFNHMNEAHIETIKGTIRSYSKVPKEVAEAMCVALDNIKPDIEPLLAKLNEIPQNEENIRICHGDLHMENFLIQNDDKVFLIDFDLIGRNFFYNDISLLLEHMSGRDEYKKQMKDGFEVCLDAALKKYLEVRPLSISFEVLKERVKLFRPILKIFWLYIFSFFLAGGDQGFIKLYQ